MSESADVVGPAVGIGFDVATAAVIAAIDQHIAIAAALAMSPCRFNAFMTAIRACMTRSQPLACFCRVVPSNP